MDSRRRRVDREQDEGRWKYRNQADASRTISFISSGRFPRTSPAAARRAATAACFWPPLGPATTDMSCRFSIRTTTRPTSTARPAASTSRHSAGERESQARGMADLRRHLDGAHVQRGRLAENSGLCHGLLQWSAGGKSLRVERRDAIHRQAVLQEVRHARRSSCRPMAIRASRSAFGISGSGNSRKRG